MEYRCNLISIAVIDPPQAETLRRYGRTMFNVVVPFAVRFFFRVVAPAGGLCLTLSVPSRLERDTGRSLREDFIPGRSSVWFLGGMKSCSAGFYARPELCLLLPSCSAGFYTRPELCLVSRRHEDERTRGRGTKRIGGGRATLMSNVVAPFRVRKPGITQALINPKFEIRNPKCREDI